MAHNILLTGVSGYLGGTLLARWRGATLPPFANVYALVRTREQADSVQQYDVHPLLLDVNDEAKITSAILTNEITIIYFLIDAAKSDTQIVMIRALAQVSQHTGKDVHFLQTSGAKLFSSHAGYPTEKPLLDTDPLLYESQRTLRGPFERLNRAGSLLSTTGNTKLTNAPLEQGLAANNAIVEISESLGVRSYIFVPCIVYGKGEGFGNTTSIQTAAIVQAAKSLRQVFRTQSGNPTWPVCHILDNTSLYLEILRKILSGEDIGHGRNGYFLASSGQIAWDDLYSAMAKGLARHNITDDDSVKDADNGILEKMGQALGCPTDLVSVQLSGRCLLESAHGNEIGWKPQFRAEHILETAEMEVDNILYCKQS